MKYIFIILIINITANLFAQENNSENEKIKPIIQKSSKNTKEVKHSNDNELLPRIAEPVNNSSIGKMNPVQENNSEKKISNSSSSQIISILKDNNQPTKKKVRKHTDEAIKVSGNQEKSILAPGNDDICSATTLPVNGTCVTSQTNAAATADYYGGCVLNTVLSVWYTFTITAPNNQVKITFVTPGGLGAPSIGNGGNVSTFLMNGACASPSGIFTICGLASSTFTFDNLAAGTYFLLVGTPTAGAGNFNICATQSVMPAGNQSGPEQECSGALPFCASTTTFAGSYAGSGTTDEVSGTCLSSGETNSMWYVFTVQASGDLVFMINTTKDYDFALYDITTIGCAGIPTATPIRCNFSATFGNTGIVTATSATTNLSESAGGTKTMPGVQATIGHTYALIVDNWSSDNTGFTLDLAGSTATNVDNTPPTMNTIVPSCTANTVLLTMSEPIKCLSVQQNDFELRYDPSGVNTDVTSKISQILGFNCPATSGAITTQIQITHDGTLVTGVYQLKIKPSPSLADKCDNKIVAGSTINFSYLANITLAASASPICNGTSVSVNANGADGTPSVATYTLNPGGLTNTTDGVFSGLIPVITTTYTVSITYGGCTKTDNTSVSVDANIVTSISPISKTICGAGTTPLTASTTINGVNCPSCTYVWSTTETINPITVGAGTYTVIATTSTGCNNSNSPSSTITSAASGAGGGTCDVIYVMPGGCSSGATCGIIKSNPSTLAFAVTLAMCTYSIIKMQVGVYTLTDFQAFDSYMTIEGGYNSDYSIKSSDMSGGSNSTTIRRTNAGDSDVPTECSVFKVAANSSLFRIQDIRIELPGSTFVTGHSNGANRTNYGIKLGANCTGFNIIRCKIDAGVGSNP